MKQSQSSPQAIYDRLHAARESDGRAIISAKETAQLIRSRLRSAFPAVKFSIRSDHNSVRISWTDGPSVRAVDAIADLYSFGGFDGTIDMDYQSDNWLTRDGRMIPASSSGTEGSRGSVPGFVSDCPEPGAIIVKYGPKYIFCNRDRSPAEESRLAQRCADYYGFTIDPVIPLHNQRFKGEYMTTLMHRFETIEEERAEGATSAG